MIIKLNFQISNITNTVLGFWNFRILDIYNSYVQKFKKSKESLKHVNEYDPIALTKSRILILHQLSCRSMWINAATLICINDDTAYTTDDLFVDTGLIYANQRHFFSKISRFPPSFKIRGENYIWFHTKSRKIASLSIFKNTIRCPENRNWKQSKCKLNLYYFPMYFYSTNANVTSFKTSFFNREWQHFSVFGIFWKNGCTFSS